MVIFVECLFVGLSFSATETEQAGIYLLYRWKQLTTFDGMLFLMLLRPL